MKLEKQITDTIKIGQTHSKQATISANKIGKLQYILTKGLYSDPITAVIAEITNNGVDSVIESGKDPKESPVLVEIDRNSQNNYFFRVTDKGSGLIPWQFKNILMNYLESTKENDDNAIGYFGLGSKSFLSLERTATFTCRRKGAQWKYLAYQGEEFCEYDLIFKGTTTEEDGVTFEIPIKDSYEKRDFVSKAIQKLAYYDTVALVIDGELQKNKIVRSDDWQYSSTSTSKHLHLCLKDVYYTIEYSKLGINHIDMPIALRFGLKDGLVVTPSRESLIYTDKVKKIILDKISKVAEWFAERYNKETDKEFDSIIDAWDQIDKYNKIIEINGVQFTINSLVSHSPTKLNEVKVKGVKTPVWYKHSKNLLMGEYSTILCKPHNDFKSHKSLIRNHNIVQRILNKEAVILVDRAPLGYIRQYLADKYKGQPCTVVTKPITRKLKVKVPFDEIVNDNASYYHLLGLIYLKKKDWRGKITEFNRVENEFKAKIIDERDVENTQAFKDWVVKHQAWLKANRIPSQGNYKSLNKQNGDITILVGRDNARDKSLVLEKKVFRINELAKQKCLFVLFNNRIQAHIHWPILRGSKTLVVCMIGNHEIKKLPLFKSKKFIKFEDFMANDCKPFQRIASAILFHRVLDDFNKIHAGRKDIFDQFLVSYVNDSQQLRKYVDDNFIDTAEVAVENAILEVAKEKDLFDKQLWDVYLRMKTAIERFDFLTCLKSPQSWDKEAIAKYKRLINQMLLFQKKYYDLEGYELVKKSQTPPVKKITDEEEEEDEEEFEEEFEDAF